MSQDKVASDEPENERIIRNEAHTSLGMINSRHFINLIESFSTNREKKTMANCYGTSF